MKKTFIIVLVLVLSAELHAQFTNAITSTDEHVSLFNNYNEATNFSYPKLKLRQRNHGVIVGLQRGAETAFEFGGEAHWRKISLRKPKITGANALVEYNFGSHVIGYKAGAWMKQGRVNFTYGGNLAYFTNFKGQHLYGLSPAVGFRFAGFHFLNGYNFLTGDKELKEVNTLFVSLRYYFPLQNKFVWDRSEKKNTKNRNSKPDKKKQQKGKTEEKKGWRKIFNLE